MKTIMFNFSLILPASAIAVPIFQIFLFVFFIAIVPGSLMAGLLSYFGVKKDKNTYVFTWKHFLAKVVNYILYHFIMLTLWVITWPQIYNDIHTGYGLPGLLPFLGIMVLWTALGLYVIYAYRMALGLKSYRPTFGMFTRLYVWNLFAMFIFRQIIYFYVTR